MAVERERIERERFIFDDRKVRQISKKAKPYKRNPELLKVVDLGSDCSVFCYPYSNPDNVFITIRGHMAQISLSHVGSAFKLAGRMRSLRHFRDRGIRSESPHRDFGKAYLKAYNAGLEKTFAVEKSPNAILHLSHREILEKEYWDSQSKEYQTNHPEPTTATNRRELDYAKARD